MNIPLLISFVCSLVVILLGIYVFRFGHRKNLKIPRYFFALSLSISLWSLLSGIRYVIPKEIHAIAPSITLLPAIFVPFLLNQLVMNLIRSDFKQKKLIFFIDLAVMVYLFLSCISLNMIEMVDYQTSSYNFLPAYHVLIMYSFGYVGLSIFLILRKVIIASGSEKVRFTLLALGISISLFTTILFVYILPLLGISKGYFIPIGLIPSSFLWAVAILQYDVFETKAALLFGDKVPFLNRITLDFHLILYNFLDPNEFQSKSVALKAVVTADILYTDMSLVLNTDLELNSRAELLARKYYQYIK
ncbi:putative membrane protein [Leptospira noguchii serovar Autumnalis str. ZUN142]|uniref:Putative membrane protein n=1 Tax=Leptospira noguchii serovar Autumnalis str. ZUN142 TaxID=1085540 RepID=M6U5N9_9LEPT|nr:histidine kinase N-terminal 7TM domain-containing protein [Leptospira noguchii]EMO39815.1 putative membrane protein [Leptospira noguchii serovar Autumnalis str. ZUN142]